MYTEKRVGPRIEPCGTNIETARRPDNRPGWGQRVVYSRLHLYITRVTEEE